MASTHKSLRSSTANKRPTTSIADGQIALNTNAASPGLFFKDSTGADIIKVGPVHVGTTAPNATPATGGSTGNSTGEVWLDTSLTPVGVKIWDGSAWQNATPSGSTTVKGLLELATNAETQTGTDTARAVTPAGVQSKMSDSTSTTSSTTIASSTAVKAAYDLAAGALPATGGTMSGQLLINSTGSLVFEGATEDEFETTVAVTDPTADRTVTIPNQSGNFLISGNASIVDADVNASAAIAGTKISPNFGSQTVQTTGISLDPGTTTSPLVRDSTGRVGIGPTAPTVPLEVSTNNTSTIAIRSGGTTNESRLFFGDDSASNVGSVIYDHSANALNFTTNGNGNIRATIDSSGRLLVGTTSSPTDPSSICISGSTASATAQGAIRLQRGSVPTTADSGVGVIYFGTTSNIHAADIAATTDGAWTAGTSHPTRLSFSTTPSGSPNPVERVRVDCDGRLLVGTTSATGTPLLTVSGNGAGGDTAVMSLAHKIAPISGAQLGQLNFTGLAADNLSSARIAGYADGAQSGTSTPGRLSFRTTPSGTTTPTERMSISSDGKFTAPTIYSITTTGGGPVYVEADGDLLRYTSSLKYKTDVETIEDARADAILNCRPVWYRSKCENDIKTEGAERSDWGWYGFIAEEVAEIEPRLVNWATKDAVTQEDGSVQSVERDPANYEAEGVRYDNFVPLLLNLIKRQKEQIEAMEARLAALEAN